LADRPSDVYITLADEARTERKVDGSRFLADALRVTSREEAESRVEAVRDREHAASHHCSAFRVGMDGDTFHYDDDGEPSGTAGRPILQQIDGRDLTNTLVVVTRYFGGTKLGTGGLARAYGGAAADVLDRAGTTEKVLRVPVRIRYRYDDTTPAEQVLRRFDTEPMEATYTDVTEQTVGVRRTQAEAFREAFVNGLGGRGEIEVDP
jgi:uncharacterized YigZ family protein